MKMQSALSLKGSAVTQWLLTAILLSLVFPCDLTASPKSYELIKQGVAQLADQKIEAALKTFESASQTDPTDAEALFFQGVAFNRLSRFGAALLRFEQSKKMGSTHPDLAFEMGWSLLSLRLWDKALVQLTAFENAHPGRGQTSEFLGRAYFGLGEHDKAETALREALKRDPKLHDTVQLYLALIARERKQPQQSLEALRSLLEDSPDSPLSRVLRRPAVSAPRRSDKAWQLEASLGGGHNSNVIFLGNGVPLPADITGQSAGFLRATLDGSYTWRLRNGDTFTANYSFLANSYKGLRVADLRDHYLYGDYRRNFSGKWAGVLRVGDEYSFIGGNSFRNQIGIRPSLVYQHSPRGITEFAYSFEHSNYFFPSLPVQNRDSNLHTFALTHYFMPRRSRLLGRVGAFHLMNNADGADYDFHSTGLLVGLGHRLGRKAKVEAVYSRTFDRYRNLHSLTGLAVKRRDDVDTLSAQITYPFARHLSGYLQYSYNRDHSNIAFFDYRQQVWSVGVVGEL